MIRYAAGIDLGSAYTKGVILSSTGEILARCEEKTGFQPEQVAGRCLTALLASAPLERHDLAAVVTTGFARRLPSLATLAITELTAAVHGARLLLPGCRTVLNVGGQTIKACRFDDAARIQAFRLNDKCASGSGAFLERTARIMNLPLEEVDRLIAVSTCAAPISSVCAVFAESEIINQLVQGGLPEDIMHGALKACVERAAQLVRQLRVEPELCLIGGVLRFQSVATMLREKLDCPLLLPAADMVQFVPALGAARIGIRCGKRSATADSAA